MSTYEQLEKIAQQNMETRFADNPCRGFVIGNNGKGIVHLSWIMGRSENSQNRVYVVDGDTVKTQAADPSKVKDPSLIIYHAMRVQDGNHIVSNGDQTDTVHEILGDKKQPGTVADCFFRALQIRHCEPDTPVFTPRITGYSCDDPNAPIYISVLKADSFAKERWTAALASHPPTAYSSPGEHLAAMERETGLVAKAFPTVRETFDLPAIPIGFGRCVTTYAPGDSKNLPSFEGEPFVVPLNGTLESAMLQFWNALDPRWRIAVAGKEIFHHDAYRIAEPVNKHGGK